ncbi:hypothetical protein L6452_36765 [Arctium lappa]|uniref:Uncharacterized protein n=1 Tax=Arctium lappa TaxID=4217 RepID=A0ACB8Y0H5_ARCLA|nr:hypothetical protein L6452_36765 [Arctium lappa]
MGKQTKSKRSIGRGKVTPVQVAFIVDRYLSDNNFVRTRSVFRSEASLLISKSPVNEAPKSLLSLGDMLDEYICLKEQKVILNQEKNRLEQEKLRVQTLLRGMQDAMNAYNVGGASASAAAPLPSPVVLPILSVGNTMASPAASFPLYNTPVMMSTSRPSNSLSEPTNFSTPTTSQPTSKRRKTTKDVSGAPLASKRSRSQPSANQLKSSGTTKLVLQPTTTSNNQETVLQITPVPSTTKSSSVQGSSVAKCLFNPSSHSPGPQTPSPSPIDKSISPVDNQTPPSSNKKTITPQQFTSTNRTVITSETIQVSPMKQVSYYSIERNHCISSPMKSSSQRFNKRDHVKGRLDFDGSEMTAINSGMITSDENTGSPSEIEDNAFDFDLPNLDCLGVDFNLTDLLGDFDLDGDRLDYFCQPASGSSPESLSGSPDTLVGGSTGDHELLSGMSSTMTEIRSEQDMNMQGPNSRTSVKSITKCIKVFSPVKSRKTTGSDQETCGVEEQQEQLIIC